MIATCWRLDLVVCRHLVQEVDESRGYHVAFLHALQISDVPGLGMVAFIHLMQVQAGNRRSLIQESAPLSPGRAT